MRIRPWLIRSEVGEVVVEPSLGRDGFGEVAGVKQLFELSPTGCFDCHVIPGWGLKLWEPIGVEFAA